MMKRFPTLRATSATLALPLVLFASAPRAEPQAGAAVDDEPVPVAEGDDPVDASENAAPPEVVDGETEVADPVDGGVPHVAEGTDAEVVDGPDGGAAVVDEDLPYEKIDVEEFDDLEDMETGVDGTFEVLDDEGNVEAVEVETPEGDFVSAETLSTTIVGDRKTRRRIVGSAHALDEKDLARLDYDDIHRVLKGVPGVYVRDEDGFGLRPNIGLRGGNSDRSSKVTLLEDGVLFGPAPYSAPAAYYFPLTARMTGVEVFKGPSAIRFGPQTVGGAVNLRTRAIPASGVVGGVDVGAGRFQTGRGHAFVGMGADNFGILVEGMRAQSGGFKHIPGVVGAPPLGIDALSGNDTGFARDDVMLKARVNTSYSRAWVHSLELKLGYGDEDSNETYLGLTDADFHLDPWQRYAASQDDRMQWRRTQAQLRWRFFWGDFFESDVVVYRHDLHRAWRRFNGFRGGPAVNDLLANPDRGTNPIFLDILRGKADTSSPDEAITLVTNDRTFVSEGVQGHARVGFALGPVHQDIEVGGRLHHDRIDREHTVLGYNMTSRTLVPDGRPSTVIDDNTGETVALSAYVVDEVAVKTPFGLFLAVPGLRLETIYSRFDDRLLDVAPAPEDTQALRFEALPGIGASWQPIEQLVFLGGVHRGFSPVSPGQPTSVNAETSWNFEAGARAFLAGASVEAIGFYNAYDNLTGECTFSGGCADEDLGAQYNAGQAMVAGLEVNGHYEAPLFNVVNVFTDASYTYTYSQFLTEFSSSFPQWGDVEVGDELPYVPAHQASLTVGLEWLGMTANTQVTYLSSMRDVAGQGPLEPTSATEAAVLVDALLAYNFSPSTRLYMRGDNLGNTAFVASRRPFGARPGKPLTFFVGLKHEFGS